MVWTLKCSLITTTDNHIWGTASRWTTNDHSSTWNFTRTYVLIRMVRRYEHSSWLYWTHLFEVPVIAVFTKYDQFLRNVGMQLADYPDEYPDSNVSDVAEKLFQEYYLHPLGDNFGYVRLESGFSVNCQVMLLADVLWQKCTGKMGAATNLSRTRLWHWMRMSSLWCF